MTRYFHRIGADNIDDLLTEADRFAHQANKTRGDVVAYRQATACAVFGSVELVTPAEDGR